MKYKVRDIRLAKKGQISHEWAKNHMPILERTLDRFRKTKPLKGITIGFCLHITKETSVLLLGAKELGATVVACGGNPLTAQDDIAAFLASKGIHVYAWTNESAKEYDWCISQVLSHKPTILVDDGADMNVMAHFDKKHKNLKIIGATEETTAGVTRIKAIEKKGKLRYPVIVVNDARTKNMFDNRYGTGQSAIDGYLRAMNLLFASKRVVVAGYGWVGRGVAQRCRGMGSKVILTEIDPVKALEAHMDGYAQMQKEMDTCCEYTPMIFRFLCFLSKCAIFAPSSTSIVGLCEVPVRCTNRILLQIRLSMHTRVFLLKLEMQQCHLVL